MPQCPSCGEKISHLKVEKIEYGSLSLFNEEPYWEWYNDVYGANNYKYVFKCPGCDEIIFENIEKAIEHLKSSK
ncbi:MAG: hypothetical protein NWF09_07745 [Candidatus Bathyarchaeota archaeon]|nr:hypothetical protein [Candidatus Bathyarchaeota archaeon]